MFVLTPPLRRAHSGVSRHVLSFAWSDTSSPSGEGGGRCVSFPSGKARLVRGWKNNKSESSAPYCPQMSLYLNTLISEQVGIEGYSNTLMSLSSFVSYTYLYKSLQMQTTQNLRNPLFSPNWLSLTHCLCCPLPPSKRAYSGVNPTICPPLPGLTRRARPERAEAAVSPSPPGRLAGQGLKDR